MFFNTQKTMNFIQLFKAFGFHGTWPRVKTSEQINGVKWHIGTITVVKQTGVAVRFDGSKFETWYWNLDPLNPNAAGKRLISQLDICMNIDFNKHEKIPFRILLKPLNDSWMIVDWNNDHVLFVFPGSKIHRSYFEAITMARAQQIKFRIPAPKELEKMIIEFDKYQSNIKD